METIYDMTIKRCIDRRYEGHTPPPVVACNAMVIVTVGPVKP